LLATNSEEQKISKYRSLLCSDLASYSLKRTINKQIRSVLCSGLASYSLRRTINK